MYVTYTGAQLGLSLVFYVHNFHSWILYINETASVHIGLSQVCYVHNVNQ